MQDVIEKIKKLLALSESTNEYEAQRANEKVQLLLTAHNLSLGDVSKVDSSVGSVEVLKGTKTVKWRKALLVAVAVFYDCQTLTWSKGKSVVTYIVGSPANSQVAVLMFEYFCGAIDRVVVEEKRRGRVIDRPLTFRHGVALRIGTKLQERKDLIASEGFTDQSGSVSALVVQSQTVQARQAIEEWFASEHPGVKEAKTKTIPYDRALNAGYGAGDAIGVDTQLNPTRQRQLAECDHG